jgi:hypothetical protein
MVLDGPIRDLASRFGISAGGGRCALDAQEETTWVPDDELVLANRQAEVAVGRLTEAGFSIETEVVPGGAARALLERWVRVGTGYARTLPPK